MRRCRLHGLLPELRDVCYHPARFPLASPPLRQGAVRMPAATISTWTIDPVHSNIEFAVQYIGITTFKGRFRNVTGTVQTDEESPAHSSVAASIDVASVDTLIAPFSERLLSEDFFAAETYPAITFQSTNVQVLDAQHALISGQLTLRGVTQAVVLDTTYHGQATHPFSG